MQVQEIGVKQIYSFENTRVRLGDLSELMQSIKEKGLLSPIIVAPNFTSDKSKGKYVIVAGNRRYNACVKLGLEKINCIVNEEIDTEKELMIINLTENIQRKSTTPWEEGRYFFKLVETYNLSVKELSVRIGCSIGYINNVSHVYRKTPAKYRDKVIYSPGNKKVPGKIALSVAKAIDSMKIAKEAKEQLYEECLKNALTETELKNIRRHIEAGNTFNQSLKAVTNITHVRLDLPMSKSDAGRLRKKYPEMTISAIIAKICYGEIKGNFDNPYK